jgi:hypothetical protein
MVLCLELQEQERWAAREGGLLSTESAILPSVRQVQEWKDQLLEKRN